MRLHTALLAALTSAIAATPACAQGAGERPIAFERVSVVPMDSERVLADQTVIVRGERIETVGPAGSVRVPSDAVRVDGRGKFVMPGVAEMHAHIPAQAGENQERTLFLYVANGITTIRGMLGAPGHLELRARAARRELTSPTIVTSGPSFNGNSVPTPEAAARMVTEQKAAGYDFLKIHPGIRREVFDTLAATAQRVGIPFSGHVPLDVGLGRALEARFASIDHLDGFVEALVPPGGPSTSQFFGLNLATEVDRSRLPALVKATREAGVAVVPTETLLEHVPAGDIEAMRAWPEMKYMPAGVIEQWTTATRNAQGNVTADQALAFVGLRREILKALSDGGVRILLGSDAPQVWNVPGFSIHREMQLMVAAGMTPYQVLSSGTRSVAEFFGNAAEVGTVAAGKRADLVLLDANPLADVGNFRLQAGVMVRGRWHPKADLDARLAALAGGQ